MNFKGLTKYLTHTFKYINFAHTVKLITKWFIFNLLCFESWKSLSFFLLLKKKNKAFVTLFTFFFVESN